MAGFNRTRLFLNTMEVMKDSISDLMPQINSEAESGDVDDPDSFSSQWARFDDALELLVRARNEYAEETNWETSEARLEWGQAPWLTPEETEAA